MSIQRSRRKIKGETFNRPVTPPEPKKVSTPERKDFKPSVRQRLQLRYRSIKSSIKSKVNSMALGKVEKSVRKKVSDSTWYGKLLFAVLDVLPLPNMHEVWKAVQKEIPDAPFGEKMKLFWEKIDGVRTVASIAVSLLAAYELLN